VPFRLAIAALLFVVGSTTSTPAQTTATPPRPEPVVATASDLPTLAELPSTTTTTTAQPPPPPTTTTTEAPQPAPVAVSAPPSAPEPPAPAGECGGYLRLIQAYWPADQVAKACAVMGCETGYTYDPTIHNPSSSASGLFQFLDSTWESTTDTPAPAANYSAETQIAAGAKLWRSSGWGAWSCA
jgi:hypothetical protein